MGQDTYIILSEQVERAEHLIVLNVKGPCGLKVTLECKHRGRLDVELFGRAHLSDLSVVLLSRDPGRPPRSAAVVVVRMGVEVLLLVLTTIVEELRHGDGLCWCWFGRKWVRGRETKTERPQQRRNKGVWFVGKGVEGREEAAKGGEGCAGVESIN